MTTELILYQPDCGDESLRIRGPGTVRDGFGPLYTGQVLAYSWFEITCRDVDGPQVQVVAAATGDATVGRDKRSVARAARSCKELFATNQMKVGPPYTPLPLEGNALFFPSTLGGGNWGGVSVDPSLGLLFVNVMSRSGSWLRWTWLPQTSRGALFWDGSRNRRRSACATPARCISAAAYRSNLAGARFLEHLDDLRKIASGNTNRLLRLME